MTTFRTLPRQQLALPRRRCLAPLAAALSLPLLA
jgi:hypothetical protein